MAEGGFLSFITEAFSPSVLSASAFINQGLNIGLSANEIGRTLTTAGLGVRRADLLQYVRYAKGAFGAAAYQRGLKGDVLPNPSLFTGSRGFTSKRYTYQVQVTGTDIRSGRPRTQYMNIATNDVLTGDQIGAQVANLAAGPTTSGGLETSSYELEAVLTDPRFLP